MYYENKPMYGLEKGLSLGQQERTMELDQRLSTRHFSDKHLAPNFNPIPVSTRYSILPITDRRAPATVPIDYLPEHSVSTNFNPGNRRAPPETFFTTIDTESSLRNLSISLQHGASQSTYVPPTSSSLYNVDVPTNTRLPTHPGLFNNQNNLSNSRQMRIQANPAVGKEVFSNNTRVQMRNMV